MRHKSLFSPDLKSARSLLRIVPTLFIVLLLSVMYVPLVKAQATGSISGTVAEAGTGNPLNYCYVDVYEDASHTWVGSAFTTTDGSYVVSRLPAGSFKVRFTAGFHLPKWYDGKESFSAADPVTLSEGEARTGINASLPELNGTSRISGRVIDGGSGLPIGGCYVMLSDVSEYTYLAGKSARADGSYSFGGLPAHEYKLWFSNSGYNAQFYLNKDSFETANVITVSVGEVKTGIDIALSQTGPGTATIRGTVTEDGTGAEVFNSRVDVYSDTVPGYLLWDKWGSSPYFTIGSLPAGSYKLRFNHDYGYHWPEWYNDKATKGSADVINLSDGENRTGIDASLAVFSGTSSISGTVTDEKTHEPIYDCYVDLFDASTNENVDSTWTDKVGNYSFDNIPAHDYKMVFGPWTSWMIEWYNNKPDIESADTINVAEEESKTINAELAPVSYCSISSVNPTSGIRGQSLTVDIEGYDTNFQEGQSNADFGQGITVTGTDVSDSTHATASITIQPGAALGPRDVNVITGSEIPMQLLRGFTVTAPAPTITSITPNPARVDQEVTITGTAFGGGGAGSFVTFHNGVIPTSYNAWGDTQIRVNVPTGATSGSVTVNTVDGTSPPYSLTVNLLQQQAPQITSVVPGSGPPGTQVTITGSGFGSSRGAGKGKSGKGASHVSFNGVAATEYPKWTDTQIVCVVPQGATPGPVLVVTSAGSSSSDKTFTVSYPTWYLAEGTTDWGYSEYITIENPNPTAVTAHVTYMTKNGPREKADMTLPASSQTTVNPRDDLGATDFSTRVTCLDGKTIAVDRTMSWTGPGAASPEAHSSTGVTSPERTWYLPEGSTAWGFECWLVIQNPNTSEATCTVTYMTEGEAPKTVVKKVPASSRATFDVSKDIGSKDASIKVTSDIPVIPERAMYRNNRREGHESIGTTTPASDYFLAEGTTAWGFTTYVLVQNPNDTPANVTVTYMTGAGPRPQVPFSMPANSRKTIRVNDILPGTDLSTQVHADKPIIAERSMYWGAGTPLGEATHDSIGMASPHRTFYLPDGETSNGRETWTLVQNPNAEQVTVEITYMTPNGQGNVVKMETIPASSRRTFGMLEHSGINGRAAIMVQSTDPSKKIMVERAMYWNSRGAGTDTIGGYAD